MISVIIPTRNRSEALKTISLSSLAKQDFKDFEVIVWDASDDDNSKKAVEEFKEEHLDMDIKYFKAPRIGSSSQRNDAVKVAKGEIVFFIDDDSEVSKDGLSTIYKVFEDKNIVGAGLPLKNFLSTKKSIKSKIIGFYYWIFILSNSSNLFCQKRKVHFSGWPCFPNGEKSGEAEWLSGCSMAYRKYVFSKFSFQEKLEKFGGYALGEDVYFSHNLSENGLKLIISKEGYVIHHAASGGRLENERKVAARFYNQYIIWKNVVFSHKRISIFAYLWSVIGEIIFYGVTGLFPHERGRIRGIIIGLRAIMNEHGKNKTIK